MEELKNVVSQTIKYSDGTETTINYNALGEVIADASVTAEETVETPAVSDVNSDVATEPVEGTV